MVSMLMVSDIKMGRNRVYSGSFGEVVPFATPGAGFIFNINIENRTCILKSLAFDVQIYSTGAPMVCLPLEQNTTQRFRLVLLSMPLGQPFALQFAEVLPPAAVVENGRSLTMYRPGQRVFNSFYIRNNLRFVFNYDNNDPAIDYEYRVAITVELEDIEST